jgi:hypothetical protein
MLYELYDLPSLRSLTRQSMSEYRRAHIPGGAYFFTVKTFERKPVLTHEHYRIALREAITEVRGSLPFDSHSVKLWRVKRCASAPYSSE